MSPERVEIVVHGTLSPEFLADVAGLEAPFCTDGHPHLVEAVPDRAVLFDRFLALRIELVSVDPVAE